MKLYLGNGRAVRRLLSGPCLAMVVVLSALSVNGARAQDAAGVAAGEAIRQAVRFEAGQARSGLSGLLGDIQALQADIDRQDEDIRVLFSETGKPGFVQRIKARVRRFREKFRRNKN